VSAESVAPSQSSSTPFVQFSGGIVQLPQPHVPLHARVPVEPQLVVQLPVEPAQHVNPSSQVPSQSSSAPLHTSDGGEQLPHPHVPLHVRLPAEPQLVVQLPVEPAQQANPLSQVPSQSSSAPLQISPGGTQLPHVHVELQLRLPVLPHPVVQPPIAP